MPFKSLGDHKKKILFKYKMKNLQKITVRGEPILEQLVSLAV